MKAKLKQHPKARPSTETFSYEVFSNGNIQIQMSEKQVAIISKQDFDERYETVIEEPTTT